MRCVCGHSDAAHGGTCKSGNSFARNTDYPPGPCATCPCMGFTVKQVEQIADSEPIIYAGLPRCTCGHSANAHGGHANPNCFDKIHGPHSCSHVCCMCPCLNYTPNGEYTQCPEKVVNLTSTEVLPKSQMQLTRKKRWADLSSKDV